MGTFGAAGTACRFRWHGLLCRQQRHDLLTFSEVNVFDPVTGLQPHPDFGIVSWRGNKDNSNYHGLSVAVKRSFSRGFLFSANYMWSHEIDDGSNGSGDGDSLVRAECACQPCERANGIWDVRHVFNANGVYQLPFGRGKDIPQSARNRRRRSWWMGNHVDFDRLAPDFP